MTAIPQNAVLLTLDQVSEMVQFAPRTIQRRVSAGQFPAPIHFGADERHTPARWVRAEVEAWIARMAQGRAS